MAKPSPPPHPMQRIFFFLKEYHFLFILFKKPWTQNQECYPLDFSSTMKVEKTSEKRKSQNLFKLLSIYPCQTFLKFCYYRRCARYVSGDPLSQSRPVLNFSS